jgi:hypothetical protein
MFSRKHKKRYHTVRYDNNEEFSEEFTGKLTCSEEICSSCEENENEHVMKPKKDANYWIYTLSDNYWTEYSKYTGMYASSYHNNNIVKNDIIIVYSKKFRIKNGFVGILRADEDQTDKNNVRIFKDISMNKFSIKCNYMTFFDEVIRIENIIDCIRMDVPGYRDTSSFRSKYLKSNLGFTKLVHNGNILLKKLFELIFIEDHQEDNKKDDTETLLVNNIFKKKKIVSKKVLIEHNINLIDSTESSSLSTSSLETDSSDKKYNINDLIHNSTLNTSSLKTDSSNKKFFKKNNINVNDSMQSSILNTSSLKTDSSNKKFLKKNNINVNNSMQSSNKKFFKKSRISSSSHCITRTNDSASVSASASASTSNSESYSNSDSNSNSNSNSSSSDENGQIPIHMSTCDNFKWPQDNINTKKSEKAQIKYFKNHYKSCNMCVKTDNGNIDLGFYLDDAHVEIVKITKEKDAYFDPVIESYWNCKKYEPINWCTHTTNQVPFVRIIKINNGHDPYNGDILIAWTYQ